VNTVVNNANNELNSELSLAFGLQFSDLYQRNGLSKLDAEFIAYLAQADVELHNKLVAARLNPDELLDADESNLLLEVAPHLEDFIGQLFGISTEISELQRQHNDLADIYSCKRLFIQRQAMRAYKAAAAEEFDGVQLENELAAQFGEAFSEENYAKHVNSWLEDKDNKADNIDLAAKYGAWAIHTAAGQEHVKSGVLFKNPRKLEQQNLVPVVTEQRDGVTVQRLPDHDYRQRKGFALTDLGPNLKQAMDHANYCIYCHHRGKDSCSKGMREKDGSFKKNEHKVTLNGCPLEEKISEMNTLKAQGNTVAALAIVTVDNPMTAGTGDRICNDCMKACIYQKQEPVDIPKVESRSLKDTLQLPWGFEIYSLLTRWNPLNLRRPLPKPNTGRRVLVAGLGPSGYTLSHHLMNDGHTVVAVDGLKIEPLPADISGVNEHGQRQEFRPIRNVQELYEELDKRTLAGFGGVAEYGITVRWNKNFLKLIRLLLERRDSFAMFGGVRFGSTITVEQAFAMGFDHVAMASGAGKPTIIDMPNGLARGVRTASDFLMALQLTGAAKENSIANLQLRLPVVVIGGGLTAIDAATESLAYYPIQVEKFLTRYEQLVAELGVEKVRARWTAEETVTAEEFIAHGQAIRAERAQAAAEGREANIIALLQAWGGVKMAYRRRLQDAPSYRLNHEEVEKAMEEGIFFAENLSPVAIDVDENNAVQSIRCTSRQGDTEQEVTLPARTILMAAGTSPNTVLPREDAKCGISLDGKYFQALDENGQPVSPEWSAKPDNVQVLMSLREDGRAMSFFGDLHPSFAGNVVKAMGSAKQGYPVISRMLDKLPAANDTNDAAEFLQQMNTSLRATVHKVQRLTPNIVEVTVKAPMAAENFQPGQFYRLQNYEKFARVVGDTTLAMEGLALTGAWVDKEQGLLSTIVLEMGGSSDLCAHLQESESIVLMGPTGEPTHTPAGETVMLVGGGLGNAVLFSIGRALRANGSRVLYFAGYKKAIDRYKIEEIEAASDVVIWCCDEDADFAANRSDDRAFKGNIVEAMVAYGSGKLGDCAIAMADVNRIIAIGSDRMMQAVAQARHGVLKPYLNPCHKALGSINSPMQCMMKEICAQCLQKHVDPKTGEESYVYSCFNQDQELDFVSFPHLNERLKQNTVQEKLTALWIDKCLREIELRVG
jgi:NADPH-dependent glutamate synthase beta subunit-like oxidoreductase/NAD(P)H-flavin reductase